MHAARLAVSRVSNRDYIAWAANKRLKLTGGYRFEGTLSVVRWRALANLTLNDLAPAGESPAA